MFVSFDCIANATSFGNALDEIGVEYTCHMRGPRIIFVVSGQDDEVRDLVDEHGGTIAVSG